MHKRICLLVVFLSLVCSSCSAESRSSASPVSDSSFAADNQQQEFYDTVERVATLYQKHKIQTVQLLGVESSDTAIVGRWVNLLQKLKVSVVVPSQAQWGTSTYPLIFITDTEEISIGSGFSSVSYILPPTSQATEFSFNIDNYEEIKESLTALKKDMGMRTDR